MRIRPAGRGRGDPGGGGPVEVSPEVVDRLLGSECGGPSCLTNKLEVVGVPIPLRMAEDGHTDGRIDLGVAGRTRAWVSLLGCEPGTRPPRGLIAGTP